jgi:hypothetical protein
METRDSFVGQVYGERYYRERETEADVVIPPALLITDERGDCWTLGVRHNDDLEWTVLRNDIWTGEFASRIECCRASGRRVRIFGKAGWKTWSGRTFV